MAGGAGSQPWAQTKRRTEGTTVAQEWGSLDAKCAVAG